MTDVLKVGLASGSSNHEEGRGKHIPSRPSQHPACFELFPLPISSSCLLCNESLSRPSLHQHPPCLLFAARHRTDAVSTVPNAYAHRRYSSPVPTANPATETRDYEAHHLLVLEGLEAVRKRPAMYIGSTDTRGLMHCLWEIIDNAVDEALGKFGNGSYNATGGLHGVGSSVVNALASRLDVEVDRNGATWAMSFRRGTPGTFDGSGPNARFTAGGGLRKVGRTAKGLTGTRVTFWPDRQIFLKDAAISLSDLDERARQTSFLVPGLALQITDARSTDVSEHRFQHNGGISEFCEFLAADEAITDVIRLRGQDRFTETVPMLDAGGHMEPRDVERDLDMDIAVRWGTGYESTIRSYVNIIATPKGGTHVAGFERALTRTFTDVLQRTRLLRAG